MNKTNMLHTSLLQALILPALLLGCSSVKTASNTSEQQQQVRPGISREDEAWAVRTIAVVGGDGKLIAEFASSLVSHGLTSESEILGLIAKIARENHLGVNMQLKSLNDLNEAFSKEDSQSLTDILGTKKEYAKFAKIYNSPAIKEIAAANQTAIQEARALQLSTTKVNANGRLEVSPDDLEVVRNIKANLSKYPDIVTREVTDFKSIHRNGSLRWGTKNKCTIALSPEALENTTKLDDLVAQNIAKKMENKAIKDRAACATKVAAITTEEFMLNDLHYTVTAEELAAKGPNALEKTIGFSCEECERCPLTIQPSLVEQRLAKGGRYPTLEEVQCN